MLTDCGAHSLELKETARLVRLVPYCPQARGHRQMYSFYTVIKEPFKTIILKKKIIKITLLLRKSI